MRNSSHNSKPHSLEHLRFANLVLHPHVSPILFLQLHISYSKRTHADLCSTRTAVLTLISIIFSILGASHRISLLFALITIMLVPQHLFNDTFVSKDPIFTWLSSLERTLMSGVWNLAITMWWRWFVVQMD